MAGQNVTVAVRVRPLSGKENAHKANACIVVQEGKQVNVVDPDDKMGGIDCARPPSCSTDRANIRTRRWASRQKKK